LTIDDLLAIRRLGDCGIRLTIGSIGDRAIRRMTIDDLKSQRSPIINRDSRNYPSVNTPIINRMAQSPITNRQ